MVWEVHFKSPSCREHEMGQSTAVKQPVVSAPMVSPPLQIPGGDGVIHVVRSQPAASISSKPGQTSVPLQALEERLNACTNVVRKLGRSITPWTTGKNRDLAEKAAQDLQSLLQETLSSVNSVMEDAQQAKDKAMEAESRLANRDQMENSLKQQQMELLAKDEELVKLQEEIKLVREQRDQQADEIHHLAAKVDTLVGDNASKLVQKLKDEKTETMSTAQLQEKVERLAAELTTLQSSNAALHKRKEEQAKKIQELKDKLRDDNDYKDREIRRLQSEVKKMTEGREADLNAAKEQAADQMKSKVREIKSLQARLESTRSTAETLKAQLNLVTKALEEAQSNLTKAQEESQTNKARCAEAKLQKEDVARELEMLKGEFAMVHSDMWALVNSQAAGSLPAAMYSKYYNKNAAWPRVAFTARIGKCLHNRACGNIDTTRIVPFEYSSHKELETMIMEGGLMMCHNCRAEPGF